MRLLPVPFPMRWLLPVAIALISACASPPVFRDAPASSPTPASVAMDPPRYHDVEVVWAGKILAVHNRETTTDMQVIAYPVDASQRPDQTAPTQGRFIVVLAGFTDPLDLPPGRYVTVRGRVDGSTTGRVDDHDIVYPLLSEAELHLWPVNFPRERGRVQFGVSVGVGLH